MLKTSNNILLFSFYKIYLFHFLRVILFTSFCRDPSPLPKISTAVSNSMLMIIQNYKQDSNHHSNALFFKGIDKIDQHFPYKRYIFIRNEFIKAR